MKLPRSRPHSSSCPSHAQSMTSDLRPGTFFTCRALTNTISRESLSHRAWKTGFQYTPVDPSAPCVHDLHNGLLPAATDQPGHVTRGSRIKIKILRFALTGSNPGYPTGAGSSVNLRAGLAGTKNKRRQRATPPVSPTQGVSSAP